jgi:hypothetical protein
MDVLPSIGRYLVRKVLIHYQRMSHIEKGELINEVLQSTLPAKMLFA